MTQNKKTNKKDETTTEELITKRVAASEIQERLRQGNILAISTVTASLVIPIAYMTSLSIGMIATTATAAIGIYYAHKWRQESLRLTKTYDLTP